MIFMLFTKGVLQPPYGFSSVGLQTLKKVTQGIQVISFASFPVILMKKKSWDTTIPGVG